MRKLKKMNCLFLLVTLNIISAFCLTCNEVLVIPDDEKLTLLELKTIQPKEILKCLAHLGKEPLGRQEADFIWQAVVEHFAGVPNVPDKVLSLLHWVSAAVTPEDFYNMTLSDSDVVQNFGLNYNLDETQLNAIADRVREDYAGKEPEDFSYYDLTVLGQILCAFNRSEIERIHPAAYKEAALIIGKLQNCNPEVLMGFADLAMEPSGFGNPDTWSQSTVSILGAVADYLPKELFRKFHINTTTKPK